MSMTHVRKKQASTDLHAGVTTDVRPGALLNDGAPYVAIAKYELQIVA